MTQATLSTAHDQWHRMFGKYQTCPFDCGANEIVAEIFESDALDLAAGAHGIRCGSCKERHASVVVVKFCHEVKRDAERFERNEAEFAAVIAAAGECEHGLSKALCAGPGHYPSDC